MELSIRDLFLELVPEEENLELTPEEKRNQISVIRNELRKYMNYKTDKNIGEISDTISNDIPERMSNFLQSSIGLQKGAVKSLKLKDSSVVQMSNVLKFRDNNVPETKAFERHVKGESNPGSAYCVSYAILITTVIARKVHNSKEIRSIYTKCFNCLNYNFKTITPLINQLIPKRNDRGKWECFLKSADLNSIGSAYFILFMTIYLSLCYANKNKKEQKHYENIANLWHLYIDNYAKETINETKCVKDILQMSFSYGDMDSAQGAFPLPKFYIERPSFMNKFLLKAFENGNNVVFLTGDRGCGKTLFAQQFALKCAMRDDISERFHYEYIIYTHYKDEGLKATISSLKCKEEIIGDRFDSILGIMKNCVNNIADTDEKKRALLIIDNFDFNERSDIQEQFGDAFKELLKTGWHILFTSKNAMKDSVKLPYQTKEISLSAFSINELKELFFSLLEEEKVIADVDHKKLEILIKDCLAQNTYLVTLAAGLCLAEQKERNANINDTLQRIIDAFDSLDISDIDTRTLSNKENASDRKETFMNHYRMMFSLSKIKRDPSKMKLLYLLSLVPLSGMLYSDFFEAAFEKEERGKMKEVYDELLSGRWISERIVEKKSSVYCYVYLHPMMREVIKESSFLPEWGNYYLIFLLEQLKQNNISQYNLSSVEKLKAVYQILENKFDIKKRKMAYLLCMIAGQLTTRYDAFHSFPQKAFEYGNRAIEWLDKYVENYAANLTTEEIFMIAKTYNNSGYALLHYRDREPSVLEHAYESIKKAESWIKKISICMKDNIKFALESSYIQGNLAAYYYAKGEQEKNEQHYKKGIEIHKEQLRYRQQLLEFCETTEQKVITQLTSAIANSLKGIASGYYYIGYDLLKPLSDFDDLYLSFNNHQEAIKLYKNTKDNHGLMIAQVRMLGAVVILMNNHFKEFSKKVDINELLENSFNQCLSAAQYYSRLKYSVPKECENWIDKTIALVNVVLNNKVKIQRSYVVKIIEQIYNLYYDHDKTREIIKQYNIKDIIQDLKNGKENKINEKNIMSAL